MPLVHHKTINERRINMKFFSTRDPERRLFESAQVIKQGLASDGGLFVPEAIPQLSQNYITKLCKFQIL